MALDVVDENSSTLSRCGSFWNRVLSEGDRAVARTISLVPSRSRVFRQLSNAAKAVLGGGYFNDNYEVVRFTDADIVYNGFDAVLRARYAGGSLPSGGTVLHDVTGVGGNGGVALGRVPDTALAMPNVNNDEEHRGVLTSVELPASYEGLFGLKVDRDLCVMSIESDGRLLVNGADFNARFGYVAFTSNPVSLFPSMKFTARSVVRRERNLYCYPLGLGEVYGPVDRVAHYYRVSQSPRALELAAAQACGMAVAPVDCTVARSVPLLDGRAYILEEGGRLDAPYPHFRLKDGAVLSEGDVVGGGELFHMLLPEDLVIDKGITHIDTAGALPVRMSIPVGPDSMVSTRVLVDGVSYARPVDLSGGGSTPPDGNSLFNGYWALLAEADGGPAAWEDGMQADMTLTALTPASSWFLDNVCGGKCITACINNGCMPQDMQVRLHEFLDREAPIGSILTYADINCTITEN